MGLRDASALAARRLRPSRNTDPIPPRRLSRPTSTSPGNCASTIHRDSASSEQVSSRRDVRDLDHAASLRPRSCRPINIPRSPPAARPGTGDREPPPFEQMPSNSGELPAHLHIIAREGDRPDLSELRPDWQGEIPARKRARLPVTSPCAERSPIRVWIGQPTTPPLRRANR